MELVIENISKKYKDKTILDSLSASFTEGIHGLLG